MSVKISELTASAQITSDDFLPIVDSGSMTTKRASAQQVLEYVTGSTFNTLTVTTLTGSTITGSTALFTSVTASYAGSGAGLTDIPNSSLLNDSITVGSTGISLGGSATTIQGLSVLTGSTVTGSTALFDNITASVALFSGDIRVLGTASIGQLNTVTQQSLIIGDKYITILSGGVDHTGINGAGFLWGTSSGPGETTGALGEHAHILYDASRDALEIFPGLYVTGSTTVFGISGTIAQFTTLTGSTVTGTLAQFTTVSASTAEISGNIVIYGSASLAEYPDYAYVLYTASYDKIVVYPGLYVSGNLTGSGHAKFNEVSGTTAEFTIITGSTVTGSTATFTTVSASVISASQYVGLTAGNVTGTGTSSRLAYWLGTNNIGEVSEISYVSPSPGNGSRINWNNSGQGITFDMSTNAYNSSIFLQGAGAGSVEIYQNASTYYGGASGISFSAPGPVIRGAMGLEIKTADNPFVTSELTIAHEVPSGGFTRTLMKTSYNSGVLINPNGNNDFNFRVNGNGGSALLLGDTSTNRIGINKTSPNTQLDVNGNTIISGNLTVTGIISGSSYLGVSGSGGSGTPGGTNTTIQFNSGSTFSGSTRLSWDYVANTFFVSGNTNITGTLNVTTTSGGSQSTTAISSIVTSSTTGSQDYAIEGNITGASAVTYTNAGINGVNSVTQTFAGTPILANGGGPIGTRGVAIGVNNTGQQTGFSFKGNTGVLGFAANSVVNIGVGGASSLLKNDATNIGVAGTAQNAGGGTAQRIGGLFSISLSSPFSFDPQYNASAALIADNINTSDPIFLARDNSSNVFTIADGGYVVSKNTTNSVTAFQVQNDIGTSLFNVDTFNQRIGIIKANPNATLDVNGNTIISGSLTVTGSTTLSTVSGTTAEFTLITASAGLIQGDLRVLGTASIGQLNTITQQSLLIGDKYITILSGGVDHTGINGSGFLWGTSSGPGETTGALGEHAHVLYDASRDSLQIFPGLYVLGNASVSGNLVVTGSITELSTRKIKTNIQTVNNQLTAISKLNPVSYVRLDDGRKEYGFISEEVKEVYPEFVVGEGINYPKMVSVLVSAVKELTDKVEKQQNEIELLKNKKKTTRGKK